MREKEKKGDFSDRLRLLMRDSTLSQFARSCGLGESLVRKYLDGAVPGIDKAHLISGATGVTIQWLVTGEGSMRGGKTADDVVSVALYDAALAAGAGALNEGAEILHHIPFRADFLKQLTGRADSKDLALLGVRGDSMESTISDGDIVLIDERDKEISDGIFCFISDGLARVKRLRKLTAGGIEIISDNRDIYPPETITPSESDPLDIIGRVRWVGHSI